MKLYKSISLVCILGSVSHMAYAAQMTPQIQRLMDEKEQKLAELEKCDSKRKGFMIAGISTLGLTAVGVTGNVLLANKNKKIECRIGRKKTNLGKSTNNT